MPALGRVEGRDADQPVHADLALQIPVGVLPAHLDGGGLDARFLAREQVDDLGLEAGALRPAQVHAHEHLRPVLGLRASRARMNGQDRVLPVLRPGEHHLHLEGFERGGAPLQALLDLGGQALVPGLGGHLPEEPHLADVASEVVERPDRAAQLGALLDEDLGLSAVVPEARRRHLDVDGG